MKKQLLLVLALLLATFTHAHAADTKISALTDGGACLSTDDIPVVRSAANRRCQLSAFQPLDDQLTDVAGLTTTDNGVIIGNGSNFVVESGATLKTSLGLTIGTNVQAYDADLTTYAGITPSANVQTMLGSADNSAIRSNIGLAIGTNVQAYDGELAALAGLTSAADKGIQFTGAGTAATYDLTTAGKALLDDASASAQRTTLGFRATEYCFAGSDFNTTALTSSSSGVAKEFLPAAFTVTQVRAYVRTAPTGTLTIDINEDPNAGGSPVTILSTKITIDANEYTGGSSGAQGTALTAAVISDTAIAANSMITVDVDSTTGGKGLVVCIEGTY